MAYRFDSGIVSALADLFTDQKSLAKQKKIIILTLTHLLYRSHNIVDNIQSGMAHTISRLLIV